MPRFAGVGREPLNDWNATRGLFEKMASTFSFFHAHRAAPEGSSRARSARLLRVVRTKPLLDVLFLPEEDSPAAGHVVILSNDSGRATAGRAGLRLGRTLTLDGEAYTIVGVCGQLLACGRGRSRRATSGCRWPFSDKTARVRTTIRSVIGG